jgi:hypothetical protein
MRSLDDQNTGIPIGPTPKPRVDAKEIAAMSNLRHEPDDKVEVELAFMTKFEEPSCIGKKPNLPILTARFTRLTKRENHDYVFGDGFTNILFFRHPLVCMLPRLKRDANADTGNFRNVTLYCLRL